MFVYCESTKSAGETAWKLIRKLQRNVFWFLFSSSQNWLLLKNKARQKMKGLLF